MFALFYTAYDKFDNLICCADNIGQLATQLGVSRRTIERAFARVYGEKPYGYADATDLLRCAGCYSMYGETRIYMYNATNW